MPTLSPISLQIPGVLREYCGGRSVLALEAATVRGALEQLEREVPLLHRNICDETGAVRRHINVFVNADNVRDWKRARHHARAGRRRHHPARRLRRLNMPDRVILTIGTKKGLFVAEAAKTARTVRRCADRSAPAWPSTPR